MWVIYRQDQADRDPEALRAPKRGTGGFKGAKAKKQNQLRRERYVCIIENGYSDGTEIEIKKEHLNAFNEVFSKE